MKAKLVGKNPVKFTDEGTGEVIEGMNLFYYARKDEVQGYFAGKLWVRSDSALYGKVAAMDLSTPTMADLEYDVQPGRRMTLVLTDIKKLDTKDFEPVKQGA